MWDRVKENIHRKRYKEINEGANNFYFGLQVVSIVFIAISICAELLCFLPTCEFIRPLTIVVSKMISVNALSGVINTAGLSCTVFTWLITKLDDKVCGISLGEIVNSVYPSFFSSYFFVFLPSILLGIYYSQCGHIWPTVWIMVPVLLNLFFSSYICYKFVICADCREQYAYEYICQRVKNGKNAEEYLLKAAKFTRMLVLEEQEMNSATNFWEIAADAINLDDYSWEKVPEEYYKDRLLDNIIGKLDCPIRVWMQLISTSDSDGDLVRLFTPILHSKVATDSSLISVLQIYEVALLFVLRNSSNSTRSFIDRVCVILRYFRDQRSVCINLSCSTLMIVALEVLSDLEEKSNLSYCIQCLANNVIQITRKDEEQIEQLLLFTELEERWYTGLTLSRYLFRLTTFFF